MPTYTSKWVSSDGTTFYFIDPYGIESWSGDKFSLTIPTAQGQGPGEYAEDALPEPRMVTIGGKLRGDTADQFQQRWQALTAALAKGAVGKLYKDSENYLECRCDNIDRDLDKGLEWCAWTAEFRVSEPLFRSETVYNQTLNPAISNAMPIGGGYPVAPLLTFNVSSIGTGGKFTVSHIYGGYSESFTITPTATGAITVDCATGKVLRGTTNAISEFSGTVFEAVEPTGSAITITFSGGATLSTVLPASASWRRLNPGA